MKEFVEYIAAQVELQPTRRFMLGITGSPGAGKSTLAGHLVVELNAYLEEAAAAMVPMDGFHLPNAILEERGLRHLKGIPETFDAQGFVSLLANLRQNCTTVIHCPSFDRALDEPLAESITVGPERKIIIVEGNYLLLQDEPWKQICSLLDEIWFLDVPTDVLMPRLIERHVLGGRSPESALEKVEGTDLRNARLIEAGRNLATRVLKPGDDGRFVLGLNSTF